MLSLLNSLPSYPYMTTGNTLALTIWTFVDKVMSLLFNMLSRFVTAFLPRSKCLLISWLQSLSAAIRVQEKSLSIEALCLNLSTINSNDSTVFLINCECFSFLSRGQFFMFCIYLPPPHITKNRFARSMCWIQGWILLCISKEPVWDDVPLSSKDHTISSN